jgi:hypothetical protein
LLCFLAFIVSSVGLAQSEPLNGSSWDGLPLNQAAGVFLGNGGDSYVLEFQESADELRSILARPDCGVHVRLFELVDVMTRVRVTSEPRLVLRGREVDAINIPGYDPQIVVSRERWDRIRGDRKLRIRLALHELLGLMGYDDSQYQVSSRLRI